MKELGEARHTMGIRIERDRSKKILQFSKTNYIQKVLKRFNMDTSKPTPTSLLTSIRLSIIESPSIEVEKEQMRKIPYASTIGSLMYTMVAIQPDLICIIGATSRYMSNPRNKHWEAIKHIFLYLRGIKNMHLTVGSGHLIQVESYTDSDYVGNPDNQKLTSRYMCSLTHTGRFLGGQSFKSVQHSPQ